MKRHYFKSARVIIAWSRTIALLICGPCLILSAPAAKTADKSKSAEELAANGDWTQESFNAAHTGYNRFETQINRNNVGSLTELWVSQVGLGGISSSPVVAYGKVYLGSGDGYVYAFDAMTGATAWVGEQQSSFFTNSPAVGFGLVFSHTLFGAIKAYDAETGAIVWTSQDALNLRASPTLNGSVLYVGSENGTLYALDARTGTMIWSARPDEEFPGVFNQAATVAGDRVFQPRVDDFDNRIWAYDKKTGELLWSKRYGLGHAMSAVQDKLFAVDPPNLFQLDQATGHEWWSAPLANEGGTDSNPSVAHGMVFVAQGAGLQALDAKTGALIWIVPSAGGIQSPTVANGVVYAPNVNGEWDAYDARDGTLLWSVTISSACGGQCTNATVVVAHGIVYLAGPDSFLRAYSVPSQ